MLLIFLDAISTAFTKFSFSSSNSPAQFFSKKFHSQSLTHFFEKALIHQKRSNPLRRGRVMNGLRRFLFVRPVRLMALLAVMAFGLLMGCSIAPQQNPYLYTGAGLGAATGAALGAGINHRNPWKGAAIGGLLGTAIGGVAGEAYGRSNPYPPYQSQPQGYYQPPQQQPQGYYQQPYYQPSS
jgi:hypothetical protein